jgi:hypothetical protein
MLIVSKPIRDDGVDLCVTGVNSGCGRYHIE